MSCASLPRGARSCCSCVEQEQGQGSKLGERRRQRTAIVPPESGWKSLLTVNFKLSSSKNALELIETKKKLRRTLQELEEDPEADDIDKQFIQQQLQLVIKEIQQHIPQ